MAETMERLAELAAKVEQTRVYRVTDAEQGQIEEVTPRGMKIEINEALVPYPRTRVGHVTVNPDLAALVEASAGAMSTVNFPDLLRQGLVFDAFSGYNEAPVTWPLFCREVASNKPQEEYLRDAGIGMLPAVPEGLPYPKAALALDGGVIIKNTKYGMILPITEEMRRFDQVGKVRDIANLLGRAARMTEEQQVMNALTTAANYTRSNATGDNDAGANTGAVGFNAAGLIQAWTTLTTMKDRKTGEYLGVLPDTLIVTPGVWFAARQLIASPETMRAAGSTTQEVYGTGLQNAFFGLVKTIIVSPLLGSSYQWVLLEAKRALYLQRVDPLQVLPPEYDYTDDTWEYRVRNWFGVGMKDDRFAFFSSSTVAPTVS